MQKIIISICLIISTTPFFSQTEKQLKGLEKELNEILELSNTAGFAVAVVEGDKVVYSKGFGYRDYENKIPVDPNTLFAIGSCTKAFTASLLGQLRDEAKLSLTDSPIKYIPELKFYNSEMNNNIMLKDLMLHRTGLPRHDYSWYLFPTHSKDSLIKRIEYLEPVAHVREKWEYNNFMYMLQGVVAERITGKSWEDNIKERFFTPLEMNRSTTTIDGLKNGQNAAFGYNKTNGKIQRTDYYDIAAMSPAGSINSSVLEMSNWMITWLNDGKFKGKQIIPVNYVYEAIDGQILTGPALPGTDHPNIFGSNYGYGWLSSAYEGHYFVEHGGAINGFSAKINLYPTDSLGIVILINQDGAGISSTIANIITDRMLGITKNDWLKEYKQQEMETGEPETTTDEGIQKTTKSSHESSALIGKYSHPGYGEFTISNQNDSLFVNLTLKKYYMKHKYYDVFDLYEIKKAVVNMEEPKFIFNFQTNDLGEINALKVKMEDEISPIEFKHIPTVIKTTKASLEKYTGEYKIPGGSIKFYSKNDVLFAFVEGQPEYELVALESNKFTFKTLEGFKINFIENSDKTITEMQLIQPNGTFKGIKKQ